MLLIDGDIRLTEQGQLETARIWVRAQAEHLRTIIETISKEILSKGPLDEFEIRKLTDPNPFSRPLCHGLVRRFPESELATGMVKNLHHTLCIKTDHTDVGYPHSDFRLGTVHVDATFAQFFPMDFRTMVTHHPNLFEGNILVATETSVVRAFGVTYEPLGHI